MSIGSLVTVTYAEDGEEDRFVIVSSNEVDSANNHISNLSPIGKALSGHKAGDLVTVSVENQKGVIIESYKMIILSVERAGRDE